MISAKKAAYIANKKQQNKSFDISFDIVFNKLGKLIEEKSEQGFMSLNIDLEEYDIFEVEIKQQIICHLQSFGYRIENRYNDPRFISIHWAHSI